MKKQKNFIVTQLHRDDLKALGYKYTENLSDKQMEAIAQDLCDLLCGNDNWSLSLEEAYQRSR